MLDLSGSWLYFGIVLDQALHLGTDHKNSELEQSLRLLFFSDVGRFASIADGKR